MPESSLADKLRSWKELTDGMRPRIEEVAHLQGEHTELAAIVEEIEALNTQEDLHISRLRDTTQRRSIAEKRGVELRGRLAAGLQAQFGKKSVVLHQFGLRPLADPERKKEEEPPAPAPSTQPPGPAPASAPQEPTRES
jgi:hypothetical protein